MALRDYSSPMLLSSDPETEFNQATTGTGLGLYAPGTLGRTFEWNRGTNAAPQWVTYQLVKTDASLTFAVGQVLIWSNKANKTVTNVGATSFTANPVAGICRVAGTSGTNGAYIYIVKKGRVGVLFTTAAISAAVAAGQPCILVETGGTTATANTYGAGAEQTAVRLSQPIIGRLAAVAAATTVSLVDILIGDDGD